MTAPSVLFTEFVLNTVKCRYDNLIHIIVLVLSESAAEDNVLACICESLVLLIQCIVLIIVYRVVRLNTGLPLCGIFAADNRLFLLAELKVLMLDYSCIRNFSVGVIYNRVALMVFLVKYLCLHRWI